MRHPDDGVLRRLLDEPDGVAEADRQHVAGCGLCLPALAAVREEAGLVRAALSVPVAPDVDAAWDRLSAAAPTPLRAVAPRRGAVQRALRRPAAAALAVAVVLGGAGTAAAGGWLEVFRTERVAPVTLTTADLLALPDLSDYGDLVPEGDPDLREVPDAAAAAAATGLDVPEVRDLPAGVTGSPSWTVGDRAGAVFTFSAAQAAAAGGPDAPAPPPGLDGSRVRLQAGPGAAQVWTSRAGVPALVVARVVAPTASSSGAPFDVLRDHLLSLPGLPPALAQQLRTFSADGSTLPLPVPADRARTTTTQVGGVPATLVTTRDGLLAAVVWVQDGAVTVVAGSLDDDEVLRVARELR